MQYNVRFRLNRCEFVATYRNNPSVPAYAGPPPFTQGRLWCGADLLSENWLKGSIEFENAEFQRLGSVVTNLGFSDWATTDIPAAVKTMWYRLSRRKSDFCIESSPNGVNFKQMRICHLHEGAGKIRFGIYACSPEESSFRAVFTNMALTECKWLPHDGQQPDEA